MRKIYSLFIILLLCLTFAEKVTDETIKRSFFFGRSADIILRPKSFVSHDDSVLITINDKKSTGESISDIDIAYSLWAPSHGVEALEQNIVSNILDNNHDLFSKTKLNLVFSIDNIGNNVLSKFSNLGLFNGEQRKLLQTSYAQDSISMLTTIISGRQPRSHGIVGSKWISKNGHLISAFKSSNTMSLVNNYPDLLSKLFVGRSIVFGSSFDFQISSAMSAHPALYADHPFWNDYGFYYDTSLESYESLYPFAVFEPDLMLSKSNILTKWEQKIGNVKISCEGSSFSIEIPEREIFATFNSENTDEFSLLSEIKFLLTSLEMFKSKENWIKLVQDDSPDYISFGFASLDKIRQLFGEESSKFKAALYAIDALIIYSTDSFKEMYEQSVHSHAVFVSPQKISFPKTVTNLVSESLSAHLLNPSIVQLPSLYLSRSAPLKQVCKTLSTIMEKVDIDVFCPSVEAESSPSAIREEHDFKPYELLVDNKITDYSNSTITYDDVLVFQLMFWFVIAMAITLVFSSCVVYAVDIPSNSNLIRQLPNIFHDPHQQRNLW